MDDNFKRCNKHHNNELINSESFIINGRKNYSKEQAELFRSHPLGGNIQARQVELMNGQQCHMSPEKKTVASAENQGTDPRIANPIKVYPDPLCRVKLDSFLKLKDSTRKLLTLLDHIESKACSKEFPPPNTNEVALLPSAESAAGTKCSSVTDIAEPALRTLEAQTKELNNIYIEGYDDDCSVFKRLTRKCNCLNQQEYNDFIIHFNEETKYSTSTIGEVIKNTRILKKFLYIGGTYTKNALIFLNEGLEKSTFAEKVEITLGCSHADLCNVFENQSIVIMCISWPCKYSNYGDSFTQNLAATFLYKLTQMEEGRRYLKYTSKITNDIKKVLRTKGSKLEDDTIENLKAALNMIYPPMTQNVNFSYYYCRQNDEGKVNEIINALQHFRKYMVLDEVFMHLDLLTNYCYDDEKRKTDLTMHLPRLLILFKDMLKEYNNSEINIIITNILNNIVSKSMLQQKELDGGPKVMLVADTSTEPVEVRHEMIQISQKENIRNAFKSKQFLGTSKFRQPSKRTVGELIKSIPLDVSNKFGNVPVVVNVPTHYTFSEFTKTSHMDGLNKFGISGFTKSGNVDGPNKFGFAKSGHLGGSNKFGTFTRSSRVESPNKFVNDVIVVPLERKKK